MTRVLIALLLVFTTVAYAAPHQVLVLRAEGAAAASSRTTVETHVLRLAKHLDGKIEVGEITLSEAAAAAGCNSADAACKDEILATFGVDEIVTTMVTPTSAGGLTVTVRRLQKGSAPRAAASTLPPGKPMDARLDQDIGPLFGAGLATTPLVDKTRPTDKTNPTQSQPADARQPAGSLDSPLPSDPYGKEPMSDNPTVSQATSPAAPAPVDTPAPSRKWQKIGIGVGAGLVLLSFVMWTQASGKQEEIDSAPHDSPADFQRLRALEDDADGLAGGGNLFFIAGVVLGGISGYYYWKKGRAARTQTARVTPTVFPHGAGLVLTLGGSQ